MNIRACLAAATAVIALMGASAASATVVNFDDLTGFGTVADGYAGMNWGAGDFYYYDSPQNPYNPSSPNTRVFSNYDQHPVTAFDSLAFSWLGLVTFDGAYFAGAGVGTVNFDLYKAGNLVHSTGPIVTNATPFFLASGYTGAVDEVHVNGNNGYYVMDDVTYHAASAAPEPAAWALMIGGFGMAGGMIRRRKAVTA